MPVHVLVITGSMGAGKTTLLGEASDILAAADIVHAAIDFDALATYHVRAGDNAGLEFRNLIAICRNYEAAGVDRLLIAAALESRAELDRLCAAIPGAALVVCRVRAGVQTMQDRVRLREPGMLQTRYVARVEVLEALIDGARVEDFAIENDGRSVTEAAREMLRRAGWPAA